MLGLSLLAHVGLGFAGANAKSTHWEAMAPALPAPSRSAALSGDTFDVDAVTTDGHAVSQEGASAGAKDGAPAPAPAARGVAKQLEPDGPSSDSASSDAQAPSPSKPRPAGEANPAPATDGESIRTTGQAFGARGLPPGVRDLAGTFTRAIPPAVSKDPVWRLRSAGDAGSFAVKLELGSEGRIAESGIVSKPGQEIPPEFERLTRRVVALLGGGQFALSASAGRQKVQLLLIDIELRDGSPSATAAPDEVVELGFTAPNELTPGRAYFTLGSGRHFEARVTLVAAP